MKVELVFSGLCSFLNVDGKNGTMGDPGVIAVATPSAHLAFVAYSIKTVKVDISNGFTPVPKAPAFKYLAIGGVELSVAGHPAGIPKNIDASYLNLVVRKDNYWPGAKNNWDRDYVPLPGDKPKATAVEAYMRFGTGDLSAGLQSKVKWQWKNVHEGNFAEEVVYSFTQGASEVVLEMRTLGDPDNATPVDVRRFSPVKRGGDVTLFIGNNTPMDLARIVKRKQTKVWDGNQPTDHFKYLNRVAGMGDGPVPDPVNPINLRTGKPIKRRVSGSSGGGDNGAPCGPDSGNN